MGKQSARLYFREKDHKDIYFQGKYHNAMYVCKDDTTPELYWRKLYDEGYFVYTFHTYYRTTSYYTAIMYPRYKIREYQGFYSDNLFHTDKFFLRVDKATYNQCWISEDGKIWNRIDLSGLGSIGNVILKWNGIVICNNLDRYGYTVQYTYYPIKNGDIDRENPIVLYSDDEHGTQTGHSVEKFANISDLFILYDDSSGSYNNVAFAVDMSGDIYDNLFSVGISTYNPSNGYFNGMYWATDRPSSKSSDGYYHVYALKATNPYNKWERISIIQSSNAQWNFGALQAKDHIVLYFAYNVYTAMQVYITRDFENLQQIDIPDNLLVPIIGQTWNEDIKYINIRLKPSAETRNDSVNAYITDFDNDIFRGRLAYVENQKISPLKSMILEMTQSISAVESTNITIYIDNLFFEESENNFAICEIYYPQGYMSDYIDKEGDDVNSTI